MQQIQIKRGLDLKMTGAAERTIKTIACPELLHFVPDWFAGVTPKMVVRPGDVVKAGSPLFYDKAFPEVLFTSPVSGTVKDVVRGERRRVLSIDITPDAKNEFAEFDMKKDARPLLLEAGLWPLLHQRPYDCIAMPSKTPRAIFLSSFDSAPLAPDYEFVLAGQEAELQAAVNALSTIAPVFIGVRPAAAPLFRSLQNCTLFEVAGPHPAGNVGVQLNNLAPLGKNETVFTLNIQDAAVIGRFFMTGKVNFTRRVALTGPAAANTGYYEVLPGTALSAIFGAAQEDTRYINGNALSGCKTTPDEFLSLTANQLTVISEGTKTHEFMGWLVRVFGIQGYRWDARIKGGRRAIIVSNEYDRVFPMDIYPEFLIKAMIAGNLEKELELGANEVAPEDFALCEYLCTSKLPLQAIVREALDNLKKEIE